jgi:glycine/D-amino acid oxidase-like deaminating enzyme
VLVVGAGLVGLSIAWLLQRRGHQVLLLDPALDGPPAANAGSWAALGVLMAQVFHRPRGRAWTLRQRSLELWGQWIALLEREGQAMAYRSGLLLLAADAAEQQRQQQLAMERQAMGLPLQVWNADRVADLQPALPASALGGLHSFADGQLDPLQMRQALLASARDAGLLTVSQKASRIERAGSHWRLIYGDGSRQQAPWLVLSASMATNQLLQHLGAAIPMQPVLGQAMELELPQPLCWGERWPGAVVWRGINLVPRPDLPGGRRLWLGATLEPGDEASPMALAALQRWGGDGPAWLSQATVVRQWQGLRCRPTDRPAPVLAQLEPGLLVATAHYRNGVLLAPATAEWVCQQLEQLPN